MPLSDDFIKSRLEYLQMQMKNNQNVTQQFYPRYQRQYNEAFPFTEGNIKNILNPQAQIIQENIPQPDDAVIEDSLKQKLNELTKNSAVTDDIFNRLQPEERYYYNQNFDAVTKELMKKIRLPTSKEEFSRNLAMVLNNDTHRNSVLGIKNFMFPPGPPAPPVAGPIGPAGPMGPAGPPGGPPLPAPAPAPNNNASAQLNAAIAYLLSFPPQPLTAYDMINKPRAEEAVGDIAYQENVTTNELAEYIFGPQYSQTDEQYADDLIYNASLRSTAPVPPAGPVPSKGPAPTSGLPPSGFLTYHRTVLNRLVDDEKSQFKAANPNKNFTKTMKDAAIAKYKKEIIDEAYQKEYEKLDRIAQAQNRKVDQTEYDLKKAEVDQKFIGFGVKQIRAIKDKQTFHDKYAIDKKKLNKNILALKYIKNANHVATFKPIEISQQFKSLIEKYVMKGHKVDDSGFKSLSVTEKRVLKRLYSFLKMDHTFDNNEDFQKQFQVMYGSFLAGNNNEDLIKQLKEYVKLAIHEAIISKAEGKKMLDKLNK